MRRDDEISDPSEHLFFGYTPIPSGDRSFPGGYTPIPSGDRSFPDGYALIPSGDRAFLDGYALIPSGDRAFLDGYALIPWRGRGLSRRVRPHPLEGIEVGGAYSLFTIHSKHQ